MKGNELITLLNEKIPITKNKVKSVVGALLTTIFLRQNIEVTEFEKIKAGMFKEVLTDLLESRNLTYMELYKAKNFLAIAEKADEYYSETNLEKSSSEYDFDWFVRFYEAAGNISDETIQNLWAKIFAGEIVQPQTYSLKTIDILKNISKKDAELFEKVASCSIMAGPNKIVLPNNKTYLEKCNINYADIMKLNEQGLMFNDGTISLTVTVKKTSELVFYNNDLVMTIASAKGNDFIANIQQYPFTQAGIELITLIEKSISNDNFIEYAKLLIKENNDYKIGVHKVIRWDENSVEYADESLL